jgi:ATP-dependent RNA helicase DeaD
LPTGFDVCEKQLFSLIHKVNNVEVNESQIEQYIPRIMDEFGDLSKEDIIKRFASLEFNRFLEYYKNAPDLNATADDRGERGVRGERTERGSRGSDGYTRLFINLGSVDDFTRGDLLSFVCNNGKISGKSIGKIDLKGVYSFFEVENDSVDSLFNNFKEVQFNNRGVRIEKSGDAPVSSERGERRSSGGSGSYSGGRREGGERKSYGGGAKREGGSSSGGFRDFSGRSRDDKAGSTGGRREGSGERRRRS